MLGTAVALGAATSGVVALLAGALAGPASAHVQKTVGPYQLTIGWKVEPAYSGVPNAVYLGVKDASGRPVDDIGNSLRVTVSTAGRSFHPLQPQLSFDADSGLGTHGEFDAAIIPTAPGVYTFHFTGAINGTAINQSIASSDSTFDDVVDPSTAQFPEKVPTAAELGTNAARVGARVDRAASKASSADDSASTAKTIGIVALVAAIVLGGGGLVVGLMGRRSSTR